MNYFSSLFTIHSSIQTVVIVSLIITVGLALGKVKVKGISLGIAWVFFIGILAGELKLSIDSNILDYIETFGLSMFVYCLGLHVGPNFFGSLRSEGLTLNMWSLAVIIFGTIFSLVLIPLTNVSLPDMVGLLCGATTNTPALGAATQALSHLGLPSNSVALATAVTYPLGVVGVIIAMIIMRKVFVKPQDMEAKPLSDDDQTYIAQFLAINPAIVKDHLRRGAHHEAEVHNIAHLARTRGHRTNGKHRDTCQRLHARGDQQERREVAELLFGKREDHDWNKSNVDWNAIDANVESRICVVTRSGLNGKRLKDIHMRAGYGVNVSRVVRGDIKLLASDDLRLQYGDRVTIVGKHEDLDNAEHFFGNSVKTLEEPNIGSIFFGIILGLALGTIPIAIPGMDSSLRLGIAGGPIIMGIIVGALGPKSHIISYTTRSASLMLRRLGLALYLACLGLDSGKDFVTTILRPEGLAWVGIGFLITVIPVLIIGIIALHTHKYDFGTICGILCGSMANPMALGYANENSKGDAASISYASVYPIGMFIRVVIAQMLIMLFT